LYRDRKIQEQIVFPLLAESHPNREISIVDFNSQDLNQPFVIYELLEVRFLESKFSDEFSD